MLSVPIEDAARPHALFLPYMGETNPYWSILASALGDAGVEVVSAEPGPFGRRWLWRNRGRIQVLHFHYVQQLYAYEWTDARLRWVVRFASNLLLARLLGYRTVFTLHNATPTYQLQPAWVDYLGHWVATNLTDAVIVHCEAARAILRARFGRRRQVYTVQHPHYMSQYPNAITRAAAKELLGISPDDFVFAFIGGLRPNKGVEGLVAAFRQLEGSNLCLLIAGSSARSDGCVEALHELAQCDGRIHLHTHFISDDKLQIYVNASDVVVLPFARILTSGSAIMAMGFARPVVAPAMGCLPELVTEGTGVLYDPSSPLGLVQALGRCVSIGPDLTAMGRRAQARVGQFTAQAAAKETLRAYGVRI